MPVKRKTIFLAVVLWLALQVAGCSLPKREPVEKAIPPLDDSSFVNLQDYIPDLYIRLAYNTENNFTGQKMYDSPVAYLRKGTADKLKKVSDEASGDGYRLVILDAYRPPEVQFKMWKRYPDSRYVANPHKGYSEHSKGCAVDLTLADEKGKELEMPSGFDEFTPRADRDYSDASPAGRANAQYLEKLMLKNGFDPAVTEWWHYVDKNRRQYSVAEKVLLPPSQVR